ncbi:MAG: transketolase C-terminal domain-containing protein [Pseudomonadota bacterium]|jgi:pyruvate/2-oxoacid:ferredoxin oxidoreductase alpha subunit|nr:pyruvate ferredoxin oxidoreductase [Syntrophaceae bacterium]MDI9554915.1 transketolase C-terminal domain-containing protein [Pseudomonadota bacterium]NLX31917.1 pyruvate ferredoxin oxidoreductase [Deltaproteobacteria bacterium]HNU85740.1 transketolase C-terminal domain-containing protein [Syntrophales bacterium]HNZ35442.1 transketolase C-terminal domain-containing protein [Syntrophales bacterium]
MTDARIITGNQAAAVAARLCDVQVIAAYPITPQSQLAEILSQFVESGQLRAEYVRVEGEHSAMTVCIGASTVGARVFTATSANGLLYMHEQLHWAAGSRLPIVMCCVNRGVGAPWSIFNDQQDSLAQRDTGWIQIYCRDNQEILDTVIQAYRIAETVYAPVMVCYDGFVLSHTMMPVVSPAPAAVRKFLPPYRPHTILDAANPLTLNSVLLPNRRPDAEGTLCDGYMEMRWKLQNALDRAPEVIREVNRSFAEAFGRDHGGMLWTHRTEDAEVILSGMGSLAAEATVAADALREEGIRAGVVGIRVYRPFPAKEAVEAFRGAKAIVLFEKSISYGYEGGLCSDLKAAFYGSGILAPIHDHVAGLGGRDVKARELVEAVKSSLARIQAGERDLKTTWLNCATE